MRLSTFFLTLSVAAALAFACDSETMAPAGPTDDGGTNGNVVDEDAGVIENPCPECICTPGAKEDCYTGPEGTRHIGLCSDGQRTCNAEGTAWGACENSVVPAAAEDCATPADDNCNGTANEDCVCTPGEESDCYTGPPATRGKGLCRAGRWTCNTNGRGHSACRNQVTPVAESCDTPGDDDCDGTVNEGCTSYAASVQPILQVKCNPCHVQANMSYSGLRVTLYSTTQIASNVCAGLTQGGCILVRLRNGSMPQGKRCTGDPARDSANAACLTRAELDTVARWVADGQRP